MIIFIHLSDILPDNNADIFAACLLISYCNFLSLLLASITMISYTLPIRLRLNCKVLSAARVVSIAK